MNKLENNIKRLVVIFALTLMPLIADAKVKVVASFSILGDMVQNVTGDLAEVTTIVGPDSDAHLYSPNIEDAVAVTKADVIFVNGMGFETWSQTLIESSKTKAKVFISTEGISPLMVDDEVDPHAWNSLLNGVVYVENIMKGMIAVDPKNADTYKSNGVAYVDRLKSTHAASLKKLNSLPKGRRTVVTAHDAFGYLANAYGLNFLAPQGINTDAEPSAKELAELISQLKREKVAALFVENITSPVLINQIAKETGLKVGGRIFSDALSSKGGPATSYIDMFKHNLGAIYEALSQ